MNWKEDAFVRMPKIKESNITLGVSVAHNAPYEKTYSSVWYKSYHYQKTDMSLYNEIHCWIYSSLHCLRQSYCIGVK